MATMTKITQKAAMALKPGAGKDVYLRCIEPRGFYLRCKPSGEKTFGLRYRNTYGREHYVSLGSAMAISVDEARKVAKGLIEKIRREEFDPASERRENRRVMTVDQACDQYIEFIKAGGFVSRSGGKKPSTIATDLGRINRHIRPLLGKMVLKDVERSDVEQLYEDVTNGVTVVDVATEKLRGRARVTGGAGTAKKAVQLLSAIFKFAKKKGFVGENPARDIEMVRDGKRKRFLTFAEYGRLGEALRFVENDAIHSTESINAIWALALSGCRRGEILNLKRAEVQPAFGGFRFFDTKTGPQDRPCGTIVFEHLAKSAAHEGVWAFPSRVSDGPISKADKLVRRLCEIADLEGVSCHTLRHSYATIAGSLGYSELTIAALLGHCLGTQTADYVHQIDEVLRDAADKVSKRIADAMGFHSCGTSATPLLSYKAIPPSQWNHDA